MGPICNYNFNKLISLWAQNIPCLLVHHVSLNFVVHIVHFPFHTPPQPHFPPPHPMQTMHHPPTPHTILTNHTPPTSSPYWPLTFSVNVEPQPNTFPILLNNKHVKPSPPSTMSTSIVTCNQTSQTTPVLPTHLQPPLRAFCLTCGHQFTLQRLTHHQHSYQTSNPFNPNLHDLPGPIPSFTPNPLALTWFWVLALDVIGSFHIGFHHLQLYNHIPTGLQHDIQMALCFPLNKLAHDPYDVTTWHLFFLLPKWCFILPLWRHATKHEETNIQLKCYLACNWETCKKIIF